jgi:hypothetical protein
VTGAVPGLVIVVPADIAAAVRTDTADRVQLAASIAIESHVSIAQDFAGVVGQIIV